MVGKGHFDDDRAVRGHAHVVRPILFYTCPGRRNPNSSSTREDENGHTRRRKWTREDGKRTFFGQLSNETYGNEFMKLPYIPYTLLTHPRP